MENELYIDFVSHTIISKLSELIVNNLVAQVNNYNKTLLHETVPTIISKALSLQAKQFTSKLSSVEEQIKQLEHKIDTDIKNNFADNFKQLEKVDAKNSEMIKKELTELNLSFSGYTQSQTELFNKILLNMKDGFNDAKELIIEGTGEKIKEIEKKTESLIAELDKKIINSFSGSFAGVSNNQKKIAGETNELIKNEISGVKLSLEEQKQEQQELFKGIIEKQLENLSGQIKESIENTDQNISKIDGKTKSMLSDLRADMKTLFDDNVENQTEKDAKHQKWIKDELKEIKQTLDTKDEAQNTFFKKTVQNQTESFNDKIDNLLNNTVENTDKLAAIGNDMKSVFNDRFDEISKQLQAKTGKQEELLSTIFYSIKKQLGASSQEKELHDQFKNQLIKNLTELQQTIVAIGAKQQESTELQNNFAGDIKKISSRLNSWGDNLDSAKDNILAIVEEKTKSISNENYSKIAAYIKEITDSRSAEKGGMDSLIQKELTELSQLFKAREQEQSNLLNTIYYSIKKITTQYDKEKEVDKGAQIEFLNSLEILYGHIRRLESEKDDLGLELLRFGGDALQKEKLNTIENELKKQKNLADKYLREKNEIEERYNKMEALWTKSLGSE
ncbi:MAG: hypothetical protein HQK65_01565 [Desulfamplus sp.]|nr:hypothetical protein [Desulfamplus sp.]